ncbi:MAG TPA: diphthamide biosynthesis enzyme Dph2 [Candidatus Thermoplasmatota archaeon]|nr:diphthamide biosynthesis enzyme Dph2 [Candidatus Thermoplasmatota archaeon]
MELFGYHLGLEELLPRIKAEHPGLAAIGLQFPDGLRDHATAIGEVVQRGTGALPVLSADPCYGACDLCDDEMAKLGVKVLIHFGHSPMPSVKTDFGVQVYYVPAHSVHPIEEVVAAAARQMKGPRIGVTTTAQHVHKLDVAERILREHGFEPVTMLGDKRTALRGQLLGCNVIAAVRCEVDEFIFIGSGDFHPLALALETEKRITAADPYTNTVRTLTEAKGRILKQRWAAIGRAKQAKTFGIVVSTKAGQMRFNLAKKVLAQLEAHGRQGFVIQNKQISPETLLYFRHLDAFVGVACPRVPIDDQMRYRQPFLTPQELEVVLGIRPPEHYVFDEFLEDSD